MSKTGNMDKLKERLRADDALTADEEAAALQAEPMTTDDLEASLEEQEDVEEAPAESETTVKLKAELKEVKEGWFEE